MPARPADLPPVPAVGEFEKGLRILEVSKAMTRQQRRMLIAHYRAQDHTLTASQLALLVDYPDWNTVNLQYGLLGQQLADRMRWTLPPDTQAAYALAWLESPGDAGEHWKWHMHPELAAALENLRWVVPLQAV